MFLKLHDFYQYGTFGNDFLETVFLVRTVESVLVVILQGTSQPLKETIIQHRMTIAPHFRNTALDHEC